EGTDEHRLLRAMLRAEYGLLEITRTVHGVGVHVIERLRGAERFVADVGFSQTARPGGALATRLVPLGDWWKTSGAPLPMTREVGPRIADLLDELASHHPNTPLHELPDLPTMIVSECLAGRASEDIAYAGAGGPPASVAFDTPAARGPGRNDPCPCG